ncbi:MAG: ATP-dependent DNA helicase [Pseudomonadota bacterium]|nr:ATP-dependent DNA helicase [Pseudomonadota bacterium]
MRAGELLDSHGPFARHLERFSPRPQQQRMANAVESALETGRTLVVEAGTGVGKTFAYLAPALASGLKVIASTGTRHLQDQLFHKDLPVVREALGVNVTAALLKGRANYLCHHRLALANDDGARFVSRRDLYNISRWAGVTRTGDIAEVAEVPEDASVWPMVTSTVDNCLGTECEFFQDCWLVRARRNAQEADLVVVNHYLFFADLAIREEGFGELLPDADAFVLDEAHQLPEIASSFFTTGISARQLRDFAADTIAEQLRDASDMRELRDLADAIGNAAARFRLSLGETERTAPWRAVCAKAAVGEALEDVHERLNDCAAALELAAERGKGLKNCHQRALELTRRLDAMMEDDEGTIRWFETTRRGFTLHLTPLDVASLFAERMACYRGAWVFTSATLAVGESFDHFRGRLGLDHADELKLDSPFDYEANAMLFLPGSMPDPGDREHTRAVVEAALPVIRANGGSAFLLFTSYRALRDAAGMMSDMWEGPMLVQGSAPRRELLERFREQGDAVLLGTGSFWEGVDVRGDALGCVVIDKLPFASPGDPVTQARIEDLRARGGNPFMELQVPRAVIMLKQGAGRLIRGEEDTGVVMICDPRLTRKHYGRVFLESLPPMAMTESRDVVTAFLSATGDQSGNASPRSGGAANVSFPLPEEEGYQNKQ